MNRSPCRLCNWPVIIFKEKKSHLSLITPEEVQLSFFWKQEDFRVMSAHIKSQLNSLRKPFIRGDTNRPVKKLACEKLACYLGVTSNFGFSDSVNWPSRISTFLAGGNCIKEIGFTINFMSKKNRWQLM